MAITYKIIHKPETKPTVGAVQFQQSVERFTAAKAKFEASKDRFVKSRFKFNNIIPIRTCKREGWDDEVNQYESCGSRFRESSCKCHSDFCAYCCAEIHGYSFALPGLIESSALDHHCSSKGNW